MMQEINGEWQLDENSYPVYSKVVEVEGINKDELWQRVNDYFIYTYRSGKDVIQFQDKENGQIIGRGLFDTRVRSGLGLYDYDCWHILKVEVRDEKIRITVSLIEYDYSNYAVSPPQKLIMPIYAVYPITPKSLSKSTEGEAFYLAHKKALGTIEQLEKVVKSGIIEQNESNDDW
jgi:hypothetical protein